MSARRGPGPQNYTLAITTSAKDPAANTFAIEAIVKVNGYPAQGKDVVFYKAVTGGYESVGSQTTDVNGRSEMPYLVTENSVKVKVELLAGSNPTRELIVVLRLEPKPEAKVVPRLEVENTPLGNGKERLIITAYNELDDKELQNMQTLISPSREVKWKNAPQVSAFQQPIPIGGLVGDLDFTDHPEVEVDVVLVGYNRKVQLLLDNPGKVVSGVDADGWQGRKTPRLAFAAIVLALCVVSIFAWFGPWVVLAIIALLAIIMGVLIGVAQKTPKFPLLLPFKTNNRWFVCMVLLTIVVIVLAVMTPIGPPLLSSAFQDAQTQQTQSENDKMRQKYENLRKYGHFQTDEEMVAKDEKAKAAYEQKKSAAAQDLQNRSWAVWVIRLVVAFLMLVLTLAYFPVAISDEVGGSIGRLARRLSNRSSGSAGESLLQRFQRSRARTVATSTQPVVTAGQVLQPGQQQLVQAPAPVASNNPRFWSMIGLGFLSDVLAEWLIEGRRR